MSKELEPCPFCNAPMVRYDNDYKCNHYNECYILRIKNEPVTWIVSQRMIDTWNTRHDSYKEMWERLEEKIFNRSPYPFDELTKGMRKENKQVREIMTFIKSEVLKNE